MHLSSLDKMKAFFDGYLGQYDRECLSLLDIGSRVAMQNQISYKALINTNTWSYTGMDIEAGQNVDIVVKDPYDWSELKTCTFDVVICGQAFEHIKFFWVTIFEIGRILKEGGLACIVAPSAGFEHKHPVDCWRFYSDGMSALISYIGFNELEVYTQWKDLYRGPDEQGKDLWKDTCLVMQKPLFSEIQRHNFLLKNAVQKMLLKNFTLQNLESISFDSKATRSLIKPTVNMNVFSRMENERLSKCISPSNDVSVTLPRDEVTPPSDVPVLKRLERAFRKRFIKPVKESFSSRSGHS